MTYNIVFTCRTCGFSGVVPSHLYSQGICPKCSEYTREKDSINE